MHGYVLAFRPGTGSGAIVTDGGETFSFNGGSVAQDLQGGDLVSFDAAATATATARDVRLVQRWSERRSVSERPLVHQLYASHQTAVSSR